MNVYTIGDSHSKHGWGDLNDLNYKVNITHLGPVLAFSIMQDWRSRFRIRLDRFDEGGVVIFHFGEIDCRCHIGKRKDPIGSLNKLVPGLLKSIAEATLDLKRLNCATIGVSTVPPPQIHKNFDSARFPVVGSPEKRKLFAIIFNTLIKRQANIYGLNVFDSASLVTDQNGFMRQEFSVDGVHISDPFVLESALRNEMIHFNS